MSDSTISSLSQHAHHWRIEEAEGPMSPGRCVDCGAERMFRNWPCEEVLQRARYAA